MKLNRQLILNVVAGLVPTLMVFAALNEDTRQSIRETLQPEFRHLLSTAFGNVLGDGTPIRVMKVQTREGLSLEVYKANNYQLVQKIDLEQKKDGYFNYHGEAANLALVDVDGDLIPEIVAPGYDQNLTAQLNVYRYDADTQNFRRLTDPVEVKMLSDL
ncbi:MAG: hypothetical protein ABL958_00580 [Bdellovibrionia bacterium]